ncbi:GSCOCG00012597001-RA-CDS, partial [Cotesia congregata]
LGEVNSNVFVQRRQWDTAHSQSTFQGMGRSLVRALFPDDVLLRSNYRGGSSKIDKNAAKRPSLDSGIMKAIKESVMHKFPNDFKQVLFGMAINNVMTELRRQNKRAE